MSDAGRRFHLSQLGREYFRVRARRGSVGVVISGPHRRSRCYTVQFDDLRAPTHMLHESYVELDEIGKDT